jgi:hypothetical protein
VRPNGCDGVGRGLDQRLAGEAGGRGLAQRALGGVMQVALGRLAHHGSPPFTIRHVGHPRGIFRCLPSAEVADDLVGIGAPGEGLIGFK